MTLGEKILLLRKARGMSQEQPAQALEVSRQAVSKWELNEAVPDVARVVAMSELFGVTTDYLLKSGGGGEKQNAENPPLAEEAPGAEGRPDRKWLGMTLTVVSSLVIFGMWAVEQIKGTNYGLNGRYLGSGLFAYLQFNGWAMLTFLVLVYCVIGGIRILLGKPFLIPIFTRKFWAGITDAWYASSDDLYSQETKEALGIGEQEEDQESERG